MKKLQSVGLIALCFALLALLCGVHAASAQDVTATITGTITDPSGAPIVGATVIAHDSDRGTNWSSVTNPDGIYNIIRIPVGSYDLKVEAKGFETAVHPAFTLVLNQTARIDVVMKVGSVTATVEVTGETPLLHHEFAARRPQLRSVVIAFSWRHNRQPREPLSAPANDQFGPARH
jgi:hypothetical protein